jgi:hypothetical protein
MLPAAIEHIADLPDGCIGMRAIGQFTIDDFVTVIDPDVDATRSSPCTVTFERSMSTSSMPPSLGVHLAGATQRLSRVGRPDGGRRGT